MNRRLSLGLVSLLALTQCGSPPPPPPVLDLTIKGGADRASPVAVRVYQLAGTAKFEQSDIFALKDAEAKTLGTEAAPGSSSQEFLLAPGDTKQVKIDLKPGVSSIGVAVMYSNIDAAKWRADAPAQPHGPTTLTATVGKLAVTLK
jgi:type VI secretion system protein VasD